MQKVRWLYQARKAGHTGTLDPYATGMLPICLGEASKTAAFMLDANKTYEARARLGVATETGDTEGAVVREEAAPELNVAEIETVLERFTGSIEQVPPMYSALKHEGQPLYKLAREGKEVERKPRTVTIHSLELIAWEAPDLLFRVRCSKGTYVRTLAEDIAEALGSCAHLAALRRLEAGPFSGGMVSLEELEIRAEAGDPESLLLPVDAGLEGWPLETLDENAARRFSHGNPVPAASQTAGNVRVYGPANRLLGIGEITEENLLKPRRIMNLEK